MTPSHTAALREAGRLMVICNACRYCEGYCAVFPAMEQRLAFAAGDLHYLANLCHDCGECLYACQYAPPHEFAVNVPRTLARLRHASYEHYAWPAALSRAFRRHGVVTSLALSAGMALLLVLAVAAAGTFDPAVPADFYSVLPHHVMVTLFGGIFTFVLVALAIGVTRFRREIGAGGTSRTGGARLPHPSRPARLTRPARASLGAAGDVLTLRYLHAHGADCTYTGEESRNRARRWFHHLTFYGFLLCFASTSVAAVYHLWFGWTAPYDYASLPVVLGAAGGLGLLAGPAGLYLSGRRRDADLMDPAGRPLDRGFIVLLFLSGVTGLGLLAFRETAAMPTLLVVHLGVVLALFVTLPYGKFVHGVYRTAALVKYNNERGA